MNNQDLLILFGYANPRYVADADEVLPPRKRIKRKTLLLIAAVLALLLVGCGALVYSRIQMKLTQHYVPMETTQGQLVEDTTLPQAQIPNALTDCYPQWLPEGYQMSNGAPINHGTRNICFNKGEQFISFSISVSERIKGELRDPEITTIQVSGWEATLQTAETDRMLGWYNETDGYYAGLYTTDLSVDLEKMARSVDFGTRLPQNFICRSGAVWDIWYPQQLPSGYALSNVLPSGAGSQILRYRNDQGLIITYVVSLKDDLGAQATNPPHSPFRWDDAAVAGQPARKLTVDSQQQYLYWNNTQEGFSAMLSVDDPNVDLVAIAESAAPGAPLMVSAEYLGSDYTIDLQQSADSFVQWESVYPQTIPAGFEMTYVSELFYGDQTIRWANDAGEWLVFVEYFDLTDWGRQFSGNGQAEAVTIHGKPGYRMGETIVWTDEAKGLAFLVSGPEYVDILAFAESVGPGPELKPSNWEKTQAALDELGHYQITALPGNLQEDCVTGCPLADSGDWYSYVRYWYRDRPANRKVYFAYETYIIEEGRNESIQNIVQMSIGLRPVEYRTIGGCVGAVTTDGTDAKIVWVMGDEKKGITFELHSEDYSVQELLSMAESVVKIKEP